MLSVVPRGEVDQDADVHGEGLLAESHGVARVPGDRQGDLSTARPSLPPHWAPHFSLLALCADAVPCFSTEILFASLSPAQVPPELET